MQDIIPGKVRSGKPDLPEGAGDGLSVGDMQHKELPEPPKLPKLNVSNLMNVDQTRVPTLGSFSSNLAVLAIPFIG
jgi:hypothetical protein